MFFKVIMQKDRPLPPILVWLSTPLPTPASDPSTELFNKMMIFIIIYQCTWYSRNFTNILWRHAVEPWYNFPLSVVGLDQCYWARPGGNKTCVVLCPIGRLVLVLTVNMHADSSSLHICRVSVVIFFFRQNRIYSLISEGENCSIYSCNIDCV